MYGKGNMPEYTCRDLFDMEFGTGYLTDDCSSTLERRVWRNKKEHNKNAIV